MLDKNLDLFIKRDKAISINTLIIVPKIKLIL
jgi:hypothetical protein